MVDFEVTCGCQRAGFRQEIHSAQRKTAMVSRASLLNGGFRLDVASTRLQEIEELCHRGRWLFDAEKERALTTMAARGANAQHFG
jgi:hypothetical protein